MRSIEHANVVRVYEVGEDRGVLFMAMEWVRGDSLRTVMRDARRRRPIPPEMAVRIIADTAAGLHAAHELRGWDGELRHLVHCDVSPHNILVGVDGRSRLVDFGVANGTAHSDPERGDQVKGKFGYMSPEQAHGESIDRRSDVFALGIVLFELTTGERLFRGEVPAHTLTLVQNARIPHPRACSRVTPNGSFRSSCGRSSATATLAIRRRTSSGSRSSTSSSRSACSSRTPRSACSCKRCCARDSSSRTKRCASRSWLRTAWCRAASSPRRHQRRVRRARSASRTRAATPRAARAPFIRRRTCASGVHPSAPCCSVQSAWPRPSAPSCGRACKRKPNALVTAPGGVLTAGQHAAGPALGANPGTDKEGVSLDSIPLAEADAQQHAAHAASAPHRTKVTLEEDPEPVASHASATEKIQLEDTRPAPVPKATAAIKPVAEVTPPATPEPAPAPAPQPPPPEGERGPLNKGAALSALAAASGRATACSSPDGPSGSARAMVTFSPDGPVTSVSVPAPFTGTGVGNCVITAFRSAHVPAFTGSSVTLPQGFRVP